MQASEFSERITALLPTLNRVALSQLRRWVEAQDAVLECVARAWEKREQLREPRFFNTWAIRILLNICHDIQRRERHEPLLFGTDENSDVREGRSATRALIEAPEPVDEEQLDRLREALFSLDERTRLILMLFYVEGYRVQEIGQLLEMRSGSVRSRLSRGRAELRRRMDSALKRIER
ncbi:MAG: RNA polymerase sigma factor [Coriobacteriales bacterium]|nr:RNA polymerase sigma factor [Coriobacteriales bacterium]